MKAIVIPVKAFGDAKSRLAHCLSAAERAALAESFCADIFQAVGQMRGVDTVFVISSEMRALDWAREKGWHTLTETKQISESESVDVVCRHCQESGIQALLRIPIDIPLVHSSDIEEILSQPADTSGCVIVPSRDGTGTNALLRSPPALFPSFFGKDSFPRHIEAAHRAGAKVKVLRNPRIELDVDEPVDLELLRGAVRPGSFTGHWLKGLKAPGPALSSRSTAAKQPSAPN
jgi:2-phospho-L-lactate/phosphoenolpyruvate guanylyltransferase